MLKLRCNNKSGLQTQPSTLLHYFRQLLLYSTPPSPPQQPPSFATYLVKSLGFSDQQSLITSTKLTQTRKAQGATKPNDFNFINNSNNVIKFFNKLGFQNTHLRKIVSSTPRILLSNVDKTLKPKIEAFQDVGLSSNDLILVISRNPNLLLRRLDTVILPAIENLKRVLDNDDDVVKVVKKSWKRFDLDNICVNLVDNFYLLVDCGTPVELVRRRFVLLPGLFLRPRKYMEGLMIRVEEELGIPRYSRMFLYGVQLLGGLSKRTIESKYEVFEKFGWSRVDVGVMVRGNPYSLMASKERIEKSLGFMMGELGFKAAYLAANPCLLMASLEKRIMPRCRILSVLKEKGLIKREYALLTITCMAENKFLKKFVLPFEEVHQVYSEYMGRPVPLLTQGREDTPLLK